MPIAFEVRETDLMGRLGLLTVHGLKIETPCLTPVIHPVTRDIPISQFEEMGFKMLMTNSLITYRRRKDEALEKGLHAMLGYDGAIMTDSGGYQVLEYGQVDITPSIIAQFQSSIGSDLAVTLDRPTGYSLSRRYARETMLVSLKGSRETIEGFGDSRTTWVGPIQGGLFLDLVRRSARELAGAGFEMMALGSPVELMDNYRFVELVRMIVAARKSTPYAIPLHLFGAGHPLTLPLSVALGCDTFDSASYVLFAKQGRYMTERGTLRLEDMAYLPCSCPACNSTSKIDLMLMERDDRVKRVALHNLYLLRQDVLRCRQAIVEGRLWDLVEERAASHPKVAAAFREMATHAEWLAKGTPFMKDRGLLIRSTVDELRPELGSARAHLEGAMKRRSEGAILIVPEENEDRPITRSKAYQGLLKLAKKEKEKGEGKPSDVYKLHTQLGPYPAELEFVYPFTQTITDDAGGLHGDAALDAALLKLWRMGYARIAVCEPERTRTFRKREKEKSKGGVTQPKRRPSTRSRSRSTAPSPGPSARGPSARVRAPQRP